MNPICIVTKSTICLDLAHRCIASALKQDIPTVVHVYDNSETGANESAWLDKYGPSVINQSSGVDLGVSGAWNFLLHTMFEEWHAEHVFMVNDDTVLPSHFCLGLLSYSAPFVTGFETNDLANLERWNKVIDPRRMTPYPDYSAFLIRKSAWDIVGEFDESMWIYCGDQDHHIRAHRLGLTLWKSMVVPFYHERSSTMKLASPEDKKLIHARADLDREAFLRKYGVASSSPEYARLFDPQPST